MESPALLNVCSLHDLPIVVMPKKPLKRKRRKATGRQMVNAPIVSKVLKPTEPEPEQQATSSVTIAADAQPQPPARRPLRRHPLRPSHLQSEDDHSDLSSTIVSGKNMPDTVLTISSGTGLTISSSTDQGRKQTNSEDGGVITTGVDGGVISNGVEGVDSTTSLDNLDDFFNLRPPETNRSTNRLESSSVSLFTI